jgi:hypothetical protein
MSFNKEYETFKQHRNSMREAFKAEFARIMDILWNEYKDKAMERIKDYALDMEEYDNMIFVDIETISLTIDSECFDAQTTCRFTLKLLTSSGIVLHKLFFCFMHAEQIYGEKGLYMFDRKLCAAKKPAKDYKFFVSTMRSLYENETLTYDVYPEVKA